jgi:hypothetical protein
VARKVIDEARRLDKRPDEAADAGSDGVSDPLTAGILEQLSDEDFGKWKM